MKHEESQVYSVPLTVPNATLKTVKIEDDFPILPSSNASWDAPRLGALICWQLRTVMSCGGVSGIECHFSQIHSE